MSCFSMNTDKAFDRWTHDRYASHFPKRQMMETFLNSNTADKTLSFLTVENAPSVVMDRQSFYRHVLVGKKGSECSLTL
jgi:hypothetical protein